MPKYLLIFEKGEGVRWLGHLDILRTFERAIRRAALPIAFSNGFNPRERISFASALSTGVTGAAELAVMELTESFAPAAIIDRLNTSLPPGIRILESTEIDDAAAKAVLTACDRAEYELICNCHPDTNAEAVEAAVTGLMAQEHLPFLREREGKTKSVDLRPHLYSLELASDSVANRRLTLKMCVGQGESGTVRPHEVAAVLACYLPGLTARRASRVRLIQNREKGTGEREK